MAKTRIEFESDSYYLWFAGRRDDGSGKGRYRDWETDRKSVV